MGNMSFFVLFVIAIVLSSCGNAKDKDAVQLNSQPTSTVQASKPNESASPKPSNKLTKDQQLSMDYISVYLNGSDIEAKKKFVADNINADVQPIFKLSESTETPKENKILNAQVIDSTNFESKGKQMTATLIKGQKNSSETEIIILTTDGKIAWEYKPSANDNDAQKAFEDMRKKFK